MPIGGELNVIFHGVFAFVFTDKCVEVLIPRTPQDQPQNQAQNQPQNPPPTDLNTVQAGTRDNPSELKMQYSYCLTGLSKATSAARLLRDDTVVLEKFRVINRADNALHCSLYLPRPSKIEAQRSVRGGAEYYFQGSTATEITAKKIALVNSFSYEYPNCDKVRLGDEWIHTWRPDPHHAINKNLHVFSETRRGVVPNTKRSFECLMRLFPEMRLELVQEAESGVADIPNLDDQRSYRELERNDDGNLHADHPRPQGISIFVDNT